MPLVAVELRVRDEVDLVRKVDVRVHHPEAVVVVVDDLQVLEDVVAEVGLNGRLEHVRPVVEQSGAFDLEQISNSRVRWVRIPT